MPAYGVADSPLACVAEYEQRMRSIMSRPAAGPPTRLKRVTNPGIGGQNQSGAHCMHSTEELCTLVLPVDMERTSTAEIGRLNATRR